MTAQNGRLGPLFDACRSEGRAALIGYLPTGYPDVRASVQAMTALVESGCDIIEVGIPYSDPGMDGPTIQRATEQALSGGVRVRDTLAAVEQITTAGGRAVVMTYWNPVLRYGVDAFARDLASAGGLGMITPDLIPDEAQSWLAAADEHELDRIFLVAPSSTPERLAATARASRGFVYAASTMGVTGARDAVSHTAPELVERVRAMSDIPVGVGLGVRSGAQAAQIGGYADGVIVGSALVSVLADGLPALRALTEDLAAGVRRRVPA
ncbi:tryptophan synthase subunit alpha [Mycobacterium sp.]|uniref:tryptophan synthase subunit alpha n=1 Tax=Mycobacterium sp. TaxID=1785 RepID=UPI003A89DAFB